MKSIIYQNSHYLDDIMLKAVMSDKTKDLGHHENRVYSVIEEYWPTSPLEIAHHLGEIARTREEKRRISTKYSYYIKKLSHKGLVVSKMSGNATIVWPVVAEKYREIHRILME
jgi:hypothetical protein